MLRQQIIEFFSNLLETREELAKLTGISHDTVAKVKLIAHNADGTMVNEGIADQVHRILQTLWPVDRVAGQALFLPLLRGHL